MTEDLSVVILADEKTRGSSGRASTPDRICGQTILDYMLNAVRSLDPAAEIIIAHGDSGDPASAISNPADLAVVRMRDIASQLTFENARSGPVLFLPSNIPLLTSSLVDELIRMHLDAEASLTVFPCDNEDASSCAAICVAQRDDFLNGALSSLPEDPGKGVASLVETYHAAGKDVFRASTGVHKDLIRVDLVRDFAAVTRILRKRKADLLMTCGVIIEDPEHTYIDHGVEIAPDTVILPGSHLRGKTRIGGGCTIGPDAFLDDAVVESGCRVLYSVVEGARVRDNTSVGPYAHIRPRSDVGPNARIGNFVEVKASRVRRGAKAGHLTYLGDADIGEEANIGAGTITCNYDGKEKHRTTIGKRAFIGSNASLVAPVKIGDDALIGAGSTITDDVPDGDLALGRASQVNKKRIKDEEEGIT